MSKPEPKQEDDFVPVEGDLIIFLPWLRARERKRVYRLISRNKEVMALESVIAIDNSQLGERALQELFRRVSDPRERFGYLNHLLGPPLTHELPDPAFLPTDRLTQSRKRQLKGKPGPAWKYEPIIP